MGKLATIRERLYKVFAAELDCEVSYLSDDTHIYRDLGMDSLDSICLVMSIEEEFGIEILDEEAEELRTVRAILDLPQLRNLESGS
jgi:acyl carrier protein